MSLQIDNQQEAYLAIMYACVSIDDNITEDETDKLIQLLIKDEIFKDADLMAIYKKVQSINQSIRFDGYRLIEMASRKINKDTRPVVFKSAVDLLQADGVVYNVEKKLLQHLRKNLYPEEM